MTKIFNFALKIKEGGREGGTCEVLRPCHPPKKKIWNVHHRRVNNISKLQSDNTIKLPAGNQSIHVPQKKSDSSHSLCIGYFKNSCKFIDST